MATRTFRYEFIRSIMETEDEVARISKGYDHSAAHEEIDIVFRSKDDGKYYAFDYQYNGDHGIDNFDGANADTPVVCREVEKREVTTTTWVSV